VDVGSHGLAATMGGRLSSAWASMVPAAALQGRLVREKAVGF
jgi:hypothetical protein